jgi:hypothetical protein
MAKFVVELRFRLEADSLESAGGAVRHLQQAVAANGFELADAEIRPESGDEPDPGWTSYGPLVGPPDPGPGP